jgi:glycosyltransferase involved in cell wall biosynthesis
MKALHITFRYGKDVFGGAELHMRHLSESLLKKGVDVDICTTMSNTIDQRIKSTVFWDNSLKDEILNSIPIYRFPVVNPNKYLSFFFEKRIQTVLDNEERTYAERIISSICNNMNTHEGLLLPGWHHVERYNGNSMRWSKGESSFLISDNSVKKISFSIYNPKKFNISMNIYSSDYSAEFNIEKTGDWKHYSYDVPHLSGNIIVRFSSSNTWRPLKDIRRISFAISDIKYTTEEEVIINLDKDFRQHLSSNKNLIHYYYSKAQKRSRIYSYMFDYLRGPNSPQMRRWLDKNVEKYDIILAQMFPFNTIKYSMIAKRHNKPLVLLPLMHVDDEFYHWPHYYDLLRGADCVLANSVYSKNEFYDRYKINSFHVGPGIDEGIFLRDTIDGLRFRKMFNLENKQIILTVSRKNPGKHYDMILRVVKKIYLKYPDIQFVMIGPDDDHIPINGPGINYLGKVAEDILADAYDACDIFVMMSESESFGMVFCEAWARKKPVIGNRHCGAVASLIDEGKNGLLCSNEKELVEAFCHLLDDSDYGQQLGQQGYEKVCAEYTWDAVADRALTCYRELLAN